MAGSLSLAAVSNELNELTSSQYAPFSHKTVVFFSFVGGGPTPKKREHHRERTWTAEAPSPNFAHFWVRERAGFAIINRVRSIPRARGPGINYKTNFNKKKPTGGVISDPTRFVEGKTVAQSV